MSPNRPFVRAIYNAPTLFGWLAYHGGIIPLAVKSSELFQGELGQAEAKILVRKVVEQIDTSPKGHLMHLCDALNGKNGNDSFQKRYFWKLVLKDVNSNQDIHFEYELGEELFKALEADIFHTICYRLHITSGIIDIF